MKKILYLLCLFPVLVWAQSSDQNYIKTLVYRDSTTAATARASATYFDGLGRPIQQVAGKMATSGKDMITHIEYDGFGRQSREYLPYPSSGSNLSFDSNAATNVFTYYSTTSSTSPNLYPQETTANPYSEKFFESSPLNRVLKQGAPGAAWQGNADPYNTNDHTVKFSYQTNIANEVRKLSVTAAIDGNSIYGTLTLNGASSYYDANTLYKTVTKNENWTSGLANTTEEFKNKEGQVILKKTYNTLVGAHETYYVYDQFGNLTYVLPPLCNGSITNIDNLGYQYKYDGRNRLAEKKLPGKQWEYIVYDPLDRPILSGPVTTPFGGSAANSGEVGWLMTIYDAFGRVAITGWYPNTINSTNRQTAQSTIGSAIISAVRGSGTIDNISVGYNNISSLPSGFKLLTVNYYDDYTWPGAPTIPSTVESQNIRTTAKGLPTGNWVRVLTSSTGTERQLSYTLYDRRGRAVRTYSSNYLGGYTQVDTQLDFDGTPKYTITKHKRSSASTPALITVREDFTYDAQDRLISQTHNINSAGAQTLASNTYNELGQLVSKGVGSYVPSGFAILPMQTVDYKYNIRGWLTQINDVSSLGTDLFAFKIGYESPSVPVGSGLSIPALYNGNISETLWRSKADNVQRKYSYKYDDLNRLTDSYYQKPASTVPYTGSYDESMRYDKNGNITSMIRKGGVDDASTQVTIDNLTYSYLANSNRLNNVSDSTNSPQGFKDVAGTGTEYTYDNNGNLTTDVNKGITGITYNHLNLPVTINFGASNKIVYLYDASGRKLKKTVTEVISGTTTTVIVDYLDGFQYKGGNLQFFPTAEGYVDNTISGSSYAFNYVYQYKDHLGNVRLSYGATKDKSTGTTVVQIVEENHYYPFGLKHLNYNMTYREYQAIEGDIVLYPSLANTPKNNYKYNGKELQDELGLNMYDYGARNYDPALGRWMNIDPLASQYFGYSPYTYALNNPIYFIDIDGRQTGGPGDDETTVNAGELNEVVINAKRSSSISWVPEISINIDLTSALFGKGYMKKYERMASTQAGRDFYKNLHKYDETEAKIYAGALALIIAPTIVAEVVIPLGSIVLSEVSLESAITGIATNTVSQAIANGGDFTKVNIIEAALSAIPGVTSTVLGETFNFNIKESDKGIQTPTSFEQGALQIGGGLISNAFGTRLDSGLEGINVGAAGKIYIEMAKFMVETASNVAPKLMD